MKLNHAIEIAKPAADVFAFVADHEHMPEWISTLESSTPNSPGPLVLHSEFKQEHQERGKRIHFDGKVTEYQASEKLTLVLSNDDATVSTTYTFTATADNTQFEQTTEVKLHNMMLRMMAGAFEGAVRDRMAADFLTLKARLEL